MKEAKRGAMQKFVFEIGGRVEDDQDSFTGGTVFTGVTIKSASGQSVGSFIWKKMRQRRINLFLFLFLIHFFPVSGNCQNADFEFDASGRLTRFPFSIPFDRNGPAITIGTTAFQSAYVGKIKDSLLRAADRLIDLYKDDHSAASALIIHFWGRPKLDLLRTDLNNWKTYLQGGAVIPFEIAHFPRLPDSAQLVSAFKIFPGNGYKGYAVPADIPSFTGTDDTVWSVDGKSQELRFKLLFADPFRRALIGAYQDDYPAGLGDWNCGRLNNALKGLADLNDEVIGLVKELNATKRFQCRPLSARILGEYTALLIKARDILPKLAEPVALYRFISDNPSFFVSWLWLNGGRLLFNPLGFSDTGNLCTPAGLKDAQAILNRSTFNAKIEEAIKECPACAMNRDSLVAWLKQRGNGASYFTLPDSLKAATDNQAAAGQFRQISRNLYGFSYPYVNEGDSSGYVYQFDGARRFKRVDVIPLRRWFAPYSRNNIFSTGAARLKRVTSNLPDDRRAFIAVHNIPAGTRLKIVESQTPIKDASAFQAGLDTATSALAGLVSDVIGVAGPAANFINQLEAPPPPPGGAIQAKLTQGKFVGTGAVSSQNKGENFDRVIPRSVWDTLRIAGKKYPFEVVNGMVVRCDDLIQFVLQTTAKELRVPCPDILIHYYLDGNKKDIYCRVKDTATYRVLIDTLILRFSSTAESVRRLAEGLYQANAELAPDNSYLASLMGMKGFTSPPAPFKADETSYPDTSQYRTDLFYPQVQTLKKDSYLLNYYKGKDTSGKKAASGEINLAPRHLFDLSIGLAGTANKVPLNTIATAGNGQVVINQDIQIFRFIAGINIYPGKLFNPDNRFIIHRGMGISSWSRLSLFLGTGLPDPLHNWYSGLSADLLPGLRLQTGVHWLWYTKYQVQNNQVQDQASAFRFGGWYFALAISPVAGVKSLLGAFK